jgi:hypothetical protein
MNGVKYSNEYQYRSKIKQENKILQSQMMERNQKRSHLTVIDGNVYQIRNQKTKSVKTKV